jgi:hypothetical protein
VVLEAWRKALGSPYAAGLLGGKVFSTLAGAGAGAAAADPTLSLNVLASELRIGHHITQNIDCKRKIYRQHLDVVARVLFAGESVNVSAH